MRFLIPLIFGVAGAAVLVGLGIWQVQRLAWKEGVLAEIEARIAADPIPLPAAPDPQTDRYTPVETSGLLQSGALRVLVSRKEIGAGYRIIAPLLARDGRRIMVDLGFVPTDEVADEYGGARIEVAGNLHWPREVDSYTPEADREANIWFAREVPEMAAYLETDPILIVANRIEPPVGGVEPLPVDTSSIPNDHLGYAVTWFSLAVIWVFMTGAFVWRGRQSMKGKAR